MNPEDQLRWEADRRLSASITAIAAGLITLVGGLVGALVYKDFPDDGPAAPVERVQFYADHAGGLTISAIVIGVSVILLAVPLRYLFVATKARRAQLPAVSQIFGLVAPVVVGIATIAQQVLVNMSAHDWEKNNPGNYFKARDATQTDPILVMAILREVGLIALGFAFVLICLNAMRAGLLTRFMGILGIIVGVLFVIPLGAPVPVVEAFWLIALGYLLGGRWPRGVPPAWAEGVAVPWPSQQELRESRGDPGGREPAHTPEPVAATSEGPVHPVSKKRKRKRRT